MTERIIPSRTRALRPTDLIAAASLFTVAASYALGFGLDWSEESEPAPLEDALEQALETPGPPAPDPVPAAKPPENPQWAPDPQTESWERMTDELGKLAASYRGRVAVVLKDLRTDNTWAFHQDDLFASASLIKLPIMICVFRKIHDGGLSLGDRFALRRRHRVGGSGSIKWLPDGTRLTVRELLYRMIGESDNTATAILIEATGLGYIQTQFPKLGLFYTEINPEGMSIRGGRVTHENYTTAREMTTLLERIYRGEMISRSASELMMDILKQRRPTRSRLAKGLPRGWEIAHKTGLVRRACHDAAIVLSPNGSYALTVLTGHNSSYSQAKEFITRVGLVTVKHYNRATLLAARTPKRGSVAIR